MVFSLLATRSWLSRSGALMYLGRWDAALEASAKAIQLDPYAAWLVTSRAWDMSMVGRPAEALTLIAQAIAMDPPGSWRDTRAACEAHLLFGQSGVPAPRRSAMVFWSAQGRGPGAAGANDRSRRISAEMFVHNRGPIAHGSSGKPRGGR